jgi:hypothetical protein
MPTLSPTFLALTYDRLTAVKLSSALGQTAASKATMRLGGSPIRSMPKLAESDRLSVSARLRYRGFDLLPEQVGYRQWRGQINESFGIHPLKVNS